MFSSKGRINRATFVVRYILLFVAVVAIAALGVGLAASYQSITHQNAQNNLIGDVVAALYFIAVIVGIFAYFSLLARRVQDVGISKYWVLVFWLAEGLISLALHKDLPLVDLAFALIPGGSSANKYGPPPIRGIEWSRLLKFR